MVWILADGSAPNWINLPNRSSISHVVFLLIPGLNQNDFGLVNPLETNPIKIDPIDEFDFFKTFNHLWPTRTPGTKQSLHSSINAILSVPLSEKAKSLLKKSLKNKKLNIEDLLLSNDELIDHDYPTTNILSNDNDNELQIDENAIEIEIENEWVQTKNLSRISNSNPHIYAIDCEMCTAKSGPVLTRVSIIDFKGETILDELVKPDEEIIDYLTRYSGIKQETLKNITTNLKDIQYQLLQIIDENDILVGHSLNCDLKVLKLQHFNIIDTSLIYQHPKGYPYKPSLKWLSEKYLNKKIQSSNDGHSSIEDAKTCIDLLKIKLKNGKNFGIFNHDENIFEKLQNFKNSKMALNMKLSNTIRNSATVDYNKTSLYRKFLNQHVTCENDDDVINGIIDIIDDNDFIVAKLKELESILGWNSQSQLEESTSTILTEESISKAKSTLNSRLSKLYDNLPPYTALIITSGNGDPRDVRLLQNLKKQYQLDYQTKNFKDIQTNWTDDDSKKLTIAVNKARDAISFLTVKKP